MKTLQLRLIELLSDVDMVLTGMAPTQLFIDRSVERDPESRVKFFTEAVDTGTARSKIRAHLAEQQQTWQGVLDRATVSGFPADQYQEPLGCDYFSEDGTRLGSLIFFRRKGFDPISIETRDLLEGLRPFFAFLFYDHHLRRRIDHPTDGLFYNFLARVSRETELSDREEDVLTLRLLGLSYRKIAESLHISEKTVSRHMGNIHKKTGCSTIEEFVARYLSPRLAPKNTD